MHEKCTVDGEEKYNLILQVDSQGSPNFWAIYVHRLHNI